MPNSVIGYVDFSDQSIVVWVEKLVGFIISEVDQDAFLARYLRNVFGHVNVFLACHLPSVLSVASLAVYRITCGRSPKNCMGNVLGLPGIGRVTYSGSKVWLDLAGSICTACRDNGILYKFS